MKTYLSLLTLPPLVSGTVQQCNGLDPQPGVASFLGAKLDYDFADYICCHNHIWAEDRGYLAFPEVDLFNRLDPEAETIWYDSVCGIPLFISPRGRSFDDFKTESLYHGWPSFRPEEIVSENVIIHDDGRMESRCRTHLGHNIPKDGIDRYCIDLLCIAGAPLAPDDERMRGVVERGGDAAGEVDFGNITTFDKLNVSTYVSSAKQYSGKHTGLDPDVIIFNSVVVISLMVILAVLVFFRKVRKRKNEEQIKPLDA